MGYTNPIRIIPLSHMTTMSYTTPHRCTTWRQLCVSQWLDHKVFQIVIAVPLTAVRAKRPMNVHDFCVFLRDVNRFFLAL